MSENKILRLATRGSALAQWQADRVAELIHLHRPEVVVEKVLISTMPDRLQNRSLSELGGDKGLFVKEVEQAVLDGRADAAVHSLKDVPVEETTPGLWLAAFPERADARDVLLTRTGASLTTLSPGSVVATGAPRRQAQLLALRPDLEVCGVRGNVETRVRKLRDGEFDAIIMAAAGLRRLGMDEQITEELSLEEFVPAPGQGILVVQAREQSPWLELWASIDNDTVRLQAEVERDFSLRIGATCHTAVGCHLMVMGQQARLQAAIFSTDGQTQLRAGRESKLADAMALSPYVADELVRQGCRNVM